MGNNAYLCTEEFYANRHLLVKVGAVSSQSKCRFWVQLKNVRTMLEQLLNFKNTELSEHPLNKEFLRNKMAFDWYMKAAELDDVYGCFNVGECYYHGKGVETDPVLAFEWYMKAADKGDMQSQVNVANAYYLGNGVEMDHHKAFLWYREAAFQGHVLSQKNCGAAYWNGDGVEKNLEECVFWYELAVNGGDAQAQFVTGCFLMTGTGVPKDERKGLKWIHKSTFQGYQPAIDYCKEHNLKWY